VYAWWLYELCDVFIELVKPVMQRPDAEAGAAAEKVAYRETLWLCLDTGLKWVCLPWRGTVTCICLHNKLERSCICDRACRLEAIPSMDGLSCSMPRYIHALMKADVGRLFVVYCWQGAIIVVVACPGRLLHPFMPFITEELWQRLPQRESATESIMVARYPQPRRDWTAAAVEADMDLLKICYSTARSLRSGGNMTMPWSGCTSGPRATCFSLLQRYS
jgi:valyl-tRNA synthetase